MSTQLSDFNTFDTRHVVFAKPEVNVIPGQKLSYKRIRMGTRYADGTIGDLILSTPPELYSFGLQESRDMATGAINGYSMPLCLWNRNGATQEESTFLNTFQNIVEHCKQHLLEHKDDIEKYDLDVSDLKKFNPLFWKMEKGKIVEGRGPTLYAKVNFSKKTNRISTIFVDATTNEQVNPFSVLNKPCHVTAAIKLESIFVGNKISLQIKLYEVVYRMKDDTIRGLLRPHAVKRSMTMTPSASSRSDTSSTRNEHDMNEFDEDDFEPYV